MKRVLTAGLLCSGFLFACVLGACSTERDVICDVTWSDNADAELGTATITYEALDDVNAGVDMCSDDQDSHEDRPSGTTKHHCDCRT